MKKNNLLYIEDIVKSCEKILEYTANITHKEFLNNELLKDAIVRNIEIIGEAANRLDRDFVYSHQEFPTRDTITMRNKLIHDYDFVDFDIVWETVINDIPRLLNICTQILKK